jgi:hypothetical protein
LFDFFKRRIYFILVSKKSKINETINIGLRLKTKSIF